MLNLVEQPYFINIWLFLFYKNMVVTYVFLLEEAAYSYSCLCILSVCILIVVCVLSMYS